MLESIGTARTYSPLLYVAALAVIVLTLWVGRRLPDIWRGGPEYERIKARFAIFGEPWATSSVSAFPVGIPFGIIGAVFCILILVRQDDLLGLRGPADALVRFIAPVFVASLLIYSAAFFFARPKFLIPPHARDHRGVIPEFLGSAKQRLGSFKPPKSGHR